MLGFFISGYVFSAVLLRLGLGSLDYTGVQTAVLDLDILECADSPFRILQKIPNFLMIPCAPGGAITLQGI